MENKKYRIKTVGILKNQRTLLLLIGVWIVFGIAIPGFLRADNILNILMSISMEGVMLIGMTYLIILGEMDLSVGAVMSFCCACAVIFQRYGVAAGLVMGLGGGVCIGLINGILVVKLKVASMPATLGMMVLINGVVYVLTKSTSIWGENKDFSAIANSTVFDLPVIVLLFIVLVLLFDAILKRINFGRNIYAIGGNEKAAAYAGINTDKVRMICFALTGLLSGLAGVLLASHYNVASGLIGGDTALMVITAVLLGGVSLSGGEGSVIKAFLGLLLVGTLNIGMQLLKLPTAIQPMVVGVVLIASLAVDSLHAYQERFK